MNRRWWATLGVVALALSACGGSGGGDDVAQAQINDQVVVDPEVVAEARERSENGDDVAEASAESSSADESDDDGAGADDVGENTSDSGDGDDDGGDVPADEPPETTVEVAEVEEDELDSLLNSLTMFNNCLADDGFDFIGAPGIGGATADEFEEAYLQSLGKCATSSDILASLDAYGTAQANRTPEEIAQFNFGLPVFRDCMVALGWSVGELVPDETGALTFGNQLEPPPGSDDFATDDIADCRLEAEQYVADNFQPES